MLLFVVCCLIVLFGLLYFVIFFGLAVWFNLEAVCFCDCLL